MNCLLGVYWRSSGRRLAARAGANQAADGRRRATTGDDAPGRSSPLLGSSLVAAVARLPATRRPASRQRRRSVAQPWSRLLKWKPRLGRAFPSMGAGRWLLLPLSCPSVPVYFHPLQKPALRSSLLVGLPLFVPKHPQEPHCCAFAAIARRLLAHTTRVTPSPTGLSTLRSSYL